MDNIGERIIDEIVYQGMVKVAAPDPNVDHVFTWNANAADQLEALVHEWLKKQKGAA